MSQLNLTQKQESSILLQLKKEIVDCHDAGNRCQVVITKDPVMPQVSCQVTLNTHDGIASQFNNQVKNMFDNYDTETEVPIILIQTKPQPFTGLKLVLLPWAGEEPTSNIGTPQSPQ
jgi:hypothetical protein